MRHDGRSAEGGVDRRVRWQALSLLLARLRGKISARSQTISFVPVSANAARRKFYCEQQSRHTRHGADRQAAVQIGATPKLEKDPVCGMNVDPAKPAAVLTHEGKTYYFCCQGCAEKFKADPAKYLATASPASLSCWRRRRRVHRNIPSYVCPMDPEIRQYQPGACPKCGMALEPELPLAASEDAVDLPDASGDRARWAGSMPDLRHGAGADDGHRSGGRKSRTARHDMALLDERPARRSPGCVRHVADGSAGCTSVAPRSRATGSSSRWPRPSCCGAAGRSSCAAGRR